MKTLYLRIYLTVVAALLLFALVSGWLLQRHVEGAREHERARLQVGGGQRMAAWAELLQNALPSPLEPAEEQAAALNDWSQRLRLPLALDDAQGRRIATSPSFARLAEDAGRSPDEAGDSAARPAGGERLARERTGAASYERQGPHRVALSDGRALWILRPARPPRAGPGLAQGLGETLLGGADGPLRNGPGGGPHGDSPPRAEPPVLFRGAGLLAALAVLFVAVAAGAWPVVRRLTRRLEALRRGVETFGAGALHHRVDESGRDEVAAVAASFNQAAGRVESLLQSHRSLLANASHELRSPLTRLKMALALFEDADPDRRGALRQEIERNIAELDALVEEVLLASRLDATGPAGGSAGDPPPGDPVDLLALCAEEAARAGAAFEPSLTGEDALPPTVPGDERLLRRALRNLLENARRYGGDGVPELQLRRQRHGSAARVALRVCDRGTGVPESERERIFEPFHRLPGHAEYAGGVGLGLSLVRQIAAHHGGGARCEPREGGGSCFIIELPLA